MRERSESTLPVHVKQAVAVLTCGMRQNEFVRESMVHCL